jgi:hypothetical protein
VVPPDCKNAKAAEKIEVADAVAIVEVLALPLLEADIVSDRLQDADQLLVEVARMHGTALRLAFSEQAGNV